MFSRRPSESRGSDGDVGEGGRRAAEVSLFSSLVDGVNVCAVVGLPVHAVTPYSRGGGGDGVVLDDLLLGACWGWTAGRAALWT